jgi:FKBP-type peptidyl-prolyl cis-trans isomerase SlyD
MARTVTLHFTLRGPDGKLLDTSLGREPLTYSEGAGQIIDGLESALRDARAGEKKRIVVPSVDAYGARDPGQVRRVPRSFLPVDGEIRAGDTFRAGEDDQAPVVTIAAVEGDEVVLDANHPLAGVDLTFDVEIVTVRG